MTQHSLRLRFIFRAAFTPIDSTLERTTTRDARQRGSDG
jgi:hypothetical protein